MAKPGVLFPVRKLSFLWGVFSVQCSVFSVQCLVSSQQHRLRKQKQAKIFSISNRNFKSRKNIFKPVFLKTFSAEEPLRQFLKSLELPAFENQKRNYKVRLLARGNYCSACNRRTKISAIFRSKFIIVCGISKYVKYVFIALFLSGLLPMLFGTPRCRATQFEKLF